MGRTFVLLIAIVAITCLQFFVFPGHSYLQSDSQLYVAALERLASPAFLSRDLVATNPHLTYTIYDEATLFFARVFKGDLEQALLYQQILFRAAAVLGLFLLARATNLGDSLSLLIATLTNFGGTLIGPAVAVVPREPIPFAFASGLMILALGFWVHAKPLSAGMAAGLALLYDPGLAAPVWVFLVIAALFDGSLRAKIKPALPMLLLALLLLANLAQLQPGLAESQNYWGRISSNWAELQQYRTPYAWVSHWVDKSIWSYLAIYSLGLWATVRIWDLLNRQLRWLFVGLPLIGILSIGVSYVLVEVLRWSAGPAIRPARTLFFTVISASLLCGLAGLRSVSRARFWETCLWFTVVFAIPVKAELFSLLDMRSGANALRLALAVAFSVLLSAVLRSLHRKPWRPVVLLIPVAASLAMAAVIQPNWFSQPDHDIISVAEWAYRSTWGNSMFVFPDAGRESYPGVFRAVSIRPVWADWKSGDEVRYSEAVASEWSQRWQQTMEQAYSPARLAQSLDSPIDYVALKQINRLLSIRPVFENAKFVVYDMTDLRNAPQPLEETRKTRPVPSTPPNVSGSVR